MLKKLKMIMLSPVEAALKALQGTQARYEDGILIAVNRLGPDPTSLAIRRYLESQGHVALGWFYDSLGRLEREGFLTFETHPGGKERDDFPMRRYSLTGKGLARVWRIEARWRTKEKQDHSRQT